MNRGYTLRYNGMGNRTKINTFGGIIDWRADINLEEKLKLIQIYSPKKEQN